MRLAAVGLVVTGLLLVVAGIAMPTCANYIGTDRDSGYPCKVDRSSGMTDVVFSRSTTIKVPLSAWLGVALIVTGGVLLGRPRRA